jgi:uncharacterized membrane protein YoaK (UPF0700 family)
VLLGIALAQNHGGTALRTLYVLVMFSLGATTGAAVARGLPDTAWRSLIVRLIYIETILLALFAMGWALFPSTNGVHYLLLACLAFAMGLQSALLNRLTIAGVTNTAVTGTLTSLLTGLQSALFAKRHRAAGDPPPRRRLGLQGAVLVLYCTGALISGFLTTHARWSIGVAPVLCLLVVLISHRKSALNP